MSNILPLYSIRFDWPEHGRYIEIQTLKGCKGDAVDLTAHNVDKAFLAKGESQFGGEVPAIGFLDEETTMFRPILLRENAEYYCEIGYAAIDPVSLMKNEAQMKGWPFISSRMNDVFRPDPPDRWKSIDRKGYSGQKILLITGRLNFGSHVGVADFSVIAADQLLIEVSSEKMEYFSDFRRMIDQIADEMTDLIIQLGMSTGLQMVETAERPALDYSAVFHMRRLFLNDNLPSAIEAIFSNPHVQMVGEEIMGRIGGSYCADLRLTAQRAHRLAMTRGGPLANRFAGNTPNEVVCSIKYDTLDTVENRYVKNFLEDLQMLCARIQKAANVRACKTGPESGYWKCVLIELDSWDEKISEWLTMPLWREVGRMTYLPMNSQVLQKRDGYRDILRADLGLQMGLSVTWTPDTVGDGTQADIRPIYDLYEIWCFLKLRRILAEIMGSQARLIEDIISFDADGLGLNLKKGKESRVEYLGEKADQNIKVTLFYNRTFGHYNFDPDRDRTFSSSYSIVFKPDFSIHISPAETGDSPELSAWVHFDAKYRLSRLSDEVRNGDDQMESSAENIRSDTNDLISNAADKKADNRKEDLEKMHAYRDAIRRSEGSYILYPGTEIRRYQYYTEILPGVGAFPFRPREENEDGDKANVQTFIEDIINFWAARIGDAKLRGMGL